ncbi:DUF3293 domain-containing protein [Haliscomenobacter sp.]|uniref:DUF3293 domain-containing protein n=1 Tax=Haliscomenobacter sp. TaxID=2717303 RepID=UPI0035945AAC
MMDNSSIPFDGRLLQAYLSTCYRVCFSPESRLDIHIGQKHPELDQHLLEVGYAHWLFITAWNPHSQLLEVSQNAAQNLALLETIQNLQLPYLIGWGIGADGTWLAEESFWVAGIERNAALDLGKKWAQNAVVWGEIGKEAELLLIADRHCRM